MSPFGDRGVFVLGRKGQASPDGKGHPGHGLPLQGVKAQIRRTGFFQMGLFFAAQVLVQPLVMLQRALLAPAVFPLREKIGERAPINFLHQHIKYIIHSKHTLNHKLYPFGYDHYTIPKRVCQGVLFMKLKERMKELRTERNLSQKKIAAELGIGITTYCRYELGEREPSASLLDQMADYYDVTTDYLLGRSDDRK